MKRQWNGSERNSWAWCESRLFEKLTCWYFFISFWERMALNSSRFWLDIRRSFSVLYRWKTPTAFTHANSTAFATSWEKKQSEERGCLYLKPSSHMRCYMKIRDTDHEICFTNWELQTAQLLTNTFNLIWSMDHELEWMPWQFLDF